MPGFGRPVRAGVDGGLTGSEDDVLCLAAGDTGVVVVIYSGIDNGLIKNL